MSIILINGLSPCPKCHGTDAKLERDHPEIGRWEVKCPCGATTDDMYFDHEAIDKWNAGKVYMEDKE